MEIAGKSPIHPFLFISGKLGGYLTWILFVAEVIYPEILLSNNIPVLRHASLVLLVSGAFFIIMSSISLGRYVRLGLPTTATRLVTSGIYRISRNPMYVGLNMVTVSAMLYVLNAAVLIAGLYSIIIYHLIILGEEKFLQQRFGENYSAYKRNTGRYF